MKMTLLSFWIILGRPKVFDKSLGRLYVETLRRLGCQRALVVWGNEGLDELSIAGPSTVWELKECGVASPPRKMLTSVTSYLIWLSGLGG